MAGYHFFQLTTLDEVLHMHVENGERYHAFATGQAPANRAKQTADARVSARRWPTHAAIRRYTRTQSSPAVHGHPLIHLHICRNDTSMTCGSSPAARSSSSVNPLFENSA